MGSMVPRSPIYVTFNANPGEEGGGPSSGFVTEEGTDQTHNVLAATPATRRCGLSLRSTTRTSRAVRTCQACGALACSNRLAAASTAPWSMSRSSEPAQAARARSIQASTPRQRAIDIGARRGPFLPGPTRAGALDPAPKREPPPLSPVPRKRPRSLAPQRFQERAG